MKILLSIHWVLGVAIWYTISGILHDFFVIKAHKGPYNRDLLRLLMDGHVLILSGIILIICYVMLLQKMQYVSLITSAIAIGMLIYCGMIYPFLKSHFTMFLSLMLIIVSIRAYINFSDVQPIIQTQYK